MLKRSFLAAAALACLSFTGVAKADYTLTLSGLNPTTFTPAGGSRFDFAIPSATQTGSVAQTFNVINVALPSATGAGGGTVTLSETFSIVGSGSTPGSLTGTLTGTFTVSGALSSFSGSFTNLVGTGFTVSGISYAAPSAGSTIGSATSGNVSFIITPTAVPEPASVAMVGLGLASVGGLALRRRRAN
ncbi:PEP-CTERM sorting domain-containing protein [Tundrisphaera sp. TA3]|uniref:PEP-CTERM sorting domain-containing protein n=1 Tax=Tundrisphaera sp. TA3 TaxID=3435775 RepID=UPI003EBA839C